MLKDLYFSVDYPNFQSLCYGFLRLSIKKLSLQIENNKQKKQNKKNSLCSCPRPPVPQESAQPLEGNTLLAMAQSL